MSQIDEYESAFKSAAKPVFHVESISIDRVMIVLDVSQRDAEEFLERARSYLATLETTEAKFETSIVSGDRYNNVPELLDIIKADRPDLICTYRNLQIPATDYPYSLGAYIDVMTQATSIPVMLLPRPELLDDSSEFPSKPLNVIAVTDHLAGDAHLVSYAARFTEHQGKLTLVHVEDQQTFDRYIATIGKIPDLDTDLARDSILRQLLKEPRDYIESCRQGLAEAGVSITVDSIVTVGHHLSDYRKILMERQIDLVVMNTKDEDQMAMHGLAYPISVEIRKTPLLLI